MSSSSIPLRRYVFPLKDRLRSSTPARSIAELKDDLLSRPLNRILDFPNPTPSYLLFSTFRSVFPERYMYLFRDSSVYSSTLAQSLYKGERIHPFTILGSTSTPPGFHLLHFPLAADLRILLPDGTDNLHAPGYPFTRRVWAGCNIVINRDLSVRNVRKSECHERIQRVDVRGMEGKEKMFVHVERKIFTWHDEKRPENSDVNEVRILGFMRDLRDQAGDTSDPPRRRPVNWRRVPDFSHTLTPSKVMLFRFSALTFNAHALHLNETYAKNSEGYHNLLVQGPLTVILMTEMLRLHLADNSININTRVDESSSTRIFFAKRLKEIQSRNLAPLYANEPLKICGRKASPAGDDEQWDLWIEDKNGGLAVKASATTKMQIHYVGTPLFHIDEIESQWFHPRPER